METKFLRNIFARLSTITNEKFQTLQKRIMNPAILYEQWFIDFKALKVCSYCNTKIKGTGKGDHLFNVVKNKNNNRQEYEYDDNEMEDINNLIKSSLMTIQNKVNNMRLVKRVTQKKSKIPIREKWPKN